MARKLFIHILILLLIIGPRRCQALREHEASTYFRRRKRTYSLIPDPRFREHACVEAFNASHVPSRLIPRSTFWGTLLKPRGCIHGCIHGYQKTDCLRIHDSRGPIIVQSMFPSILSHTWCPPLTLPLVALPFTFYLA